MSTDPGAAFDLLAARTPAPGAGAAAAWACAMSAALVEMVAAFSEGEGEVGSAASGLRARALELAEVDAEAYRAYLAARAEGPDAARAALVAAAEVARLAAGLFERGNPNLRGEALTAATLAEGAAAAAVALAEIDLDGPSERGRQVARAAAESRGRTAPA
ncbi:MAG: methenyltetrahydrofolate cyclohydrolase [Thermoleophilales bacterium]|nr:methenyltetrahydrofolate cyclohydrolase [Thermoleophilales bacterium]